MSKEEESPALLISGYWLLQINCGQPVLRGPYVSDEARVSEFDMCLIDPGTEYVIFIDPFPAPAYAWKPSKEYERERLDYINNLPDDA